MAGILILIFNLSVQYLFLIPYVFHFRNILNKFVLEWNMRIGVNKSCWDAHRQIIVKNIS